VASGDAMHDDVTNVRLHDDALLSLVSGTALRRKAAGASEKEPQAWVFPGRASLTM
jgi:hypothetical protein